MCCATLSDTQRTVHYGQKPTDPDPHGTSRHALFQLVTGKLVSQAIATVVEIGVPDLLSKGARHCSDIARATGVTEDGVYRLLRVLASVGVFSEVGNRRFRLTPMGQALRSDHPDSLAGYARFTGHDMTWRPWGQLAYSVRTGLPAFEHVFGAFLFEEMSKNPEAAAVFDQAMTSISLFQARAAVAIPSKESRR